MFWTRLIVSLSELVLSVLMAVFVIFWSYKSFIKLQTAYDLETELRKDNAAVAILLTAMMVATSVLMHESIYPVIGILTVYLTSLGTSGLGLGRVALYCAGHLVLGFTLAVGSVRLSLYLFEHLATGIEEEKEIRRGNTAVAIVMAGVVLVTTLYIQQGVSGLTKSLIPQPPLGEVQTFR